MSAEHQTNREATVQSIRERLAQEPLSGTALWEDILAELNIGDFKIRGSGVIVVLCVFHQERTPSLFLYPSGNYICYGCGNCGDTADFLTTGLTVQQISDPLERVFELGYPETNRTPVQIIGQLVLFEDR